MNKVVLRAPGKINWTLDVLSRRPDGYHEVEMLLQSIALADEITLVETRGGITVRSNSAAIPLDYRNIAVKAAQLLKEACHIRQGVEIYIMKNIPIAAGLAGGSSDAAAVLVGLNTLWKLGLTQDKLMELGGLLGADVPFCIAGGTAVARGIGQQLNFLPPVKRHWLVLIKPSFGVSTARVYQELQISRIKTRPDTMEAIQALHTGNVLKLGDSMVNVLETATIPKHPEIASIKEVLLEEGAAASLMSGSGPTVYGLYEEKEEAAQALERMKARFDEIYLTHTTLCGVEIIEGGIQ